MFKKISIIGLGLIGSSIIHAMKAQGDLYQVTGYDANEDIRQRARDINLIPNEGIKDTAREAVQDADLVILCVPVGVSADVCRDIASFMKQGAVLSDVGSVKEKVIQDVMPVLEELERQDIHFVPAHPIAGTENSGPEAGFAELFSGRWCILTPTDEANEQAVADLSALWEGFGSKVEIMSADHHDKVLGITSHLPHLIAYTIVGTATDLEEDIKSEVIKFSASGFRDFTRIAASNPTMWRDIFLGNKEAVLDILQRFNEDLTELQKSIRRGEGEKLFDFFSKTREIRRGVIDAGQHQMPKKPKDS
jgi:cyclohexadieny/prephenate dehydrogenase